MSHKNQTPWQAFMVVNTILMVGIAAICLFPLLHILAISLSEGWAVQSGMVGLWPAHFTLESYKFVALKPEFAKSFAITLERVAIGVPFTMLITILVAYPLAKRQSEFRYRNAYAWFFVFTMLFSGGMIPTYMVVNQTGLINSLWALIVPSAVQVFNIIILFNFFRQIPDEIEESAFIDGASYWRSLWSIYIPLSMPALATVTLFVLITHWNSWFDGILYLNQPDKYPLQSYLRTVIIRPDIKISASMEENLGLLTIISQRNSRAAETILAMIPILLVYPFLQKYFTTGIMLGSVKG